MPTSHCGLSLTLCNCKVLFFVTSSGGAKIGTKIKTSLRKDLPIYIMDRGAGRESEYSC